MKSNLLKVFIGYDAVETVAWHAMAHSIYTKSSMPVAITPLSLENLKAEFWRERDAKQSNEFSYTRFLVPHLCNYEGYALFFDCDMMLRVDIAEIMQIIEAQPGKAVYVVKHDYTPRDEIKFLGTTQYKYPRKNWSSVVLWNCSHPANRCVDTEFVNTQSPMTLHRFSWLKDEDIGELDVRWNWLVGEYMDPPTDVKNVHWTVGGPWFDEYQNADFSEEWFATRDSMLATLQRQRR